MSWITEYIKLIPAGIANADKVVEGVWNNIQMEKKWLPENKKKEILRRRLICATCPFMSRNAQGNPAIGYQTDRTDDHCIHCGCPIIVRTASLKKPCGIEKYNQDHPESPMELKWDVYKN